jgi:hypothetical protein
MKRQKKLFLSEFRRAFPFIITSTEKKKDFMGSSGNDPNLNLTQPVISYAQWCKYN